MCSIHEYGPESGLWRFFITLLRILYLYKTQPRFCIQKRNCQSVFESKLKYFAFLYKYLRTHPFAQFAKVVNFVQRTCELWSNFHETGTCSVHSNYTTFEIFIVNTVQLTHMAEKPLGLVSAFIQKPYSTGRLSALIRVYYKNMQVGSSNFQELRRSGCIYSIHLLTTYTKDNCTFTINCSRTH